MNFIVIGLGSMGKRRIGLLKQYIEKENKNWNIVGVDLIEERRKECGEKFGIKTCATIEEAADLYPVHCGIVSTSPKSHGSIIKKCLNMGLHIFSEINLMDKEYDENIQLAKNANRVLFLSSTFLYRKEIQYIKNLVSEVQFKGIYRHHVGQYLPEWHPWESFKNYFIGKRETNGCREIMAIELPWLIDTFGKIKSFHCIHKKVSDLDIDFDDCYQIMLEHESGVTGSLIVDVVIPKMGRRFEMWQENLYLSWDGTPDSLREYNSGSQAMEKISLYEEFNHDNNYNHSIVEDAYYDELINFIEVVQKKGVAKYCFEKDKEILELIDELER